MIAAPSQPHAHSAAAYALAYARLNWPVLLLRPGSKLPAGRHGFRDAVADVAELERRFRAQPDAGVGIWPGPAGLLVLDIDVKDGRNGEHELQALQDRHGPLPQTLAQRTPSGGRHLFYRLPDGALPPGNTQLPGCKSVDIRSAAGYVAAEGVKLPAGRYAFDDWDPLSGEPPDIAEAPAWLVRLLSPSPSTSTTGHAQGPAAQDLLARLPARLRQVVVEGAPEGQRSERFFSVVAAAADAGLAANQIVDLLAAHPKGISAKYAARLAAEVERCLAKAKAKPPAAALSEPEVQERAPLAPPTMRSEGMPGVLGDIVSAACASSEAHPVAVAATALALFSCLIGRGPFQRIGDAVIHARLFALIVGRSGKSRKGTSEATVREIFRRVSAILRGRLGTKDTLRMHEGGLSTGEGLAWAIRDAVEADEKGRGGDPGVNDKRLLVIEPEFANVLSQCQREGNTLSATVRNLWDGRDIEPLTKTSQTKASRPHVAVIGHITGFEFRERSSENDASNGLLNRFVTLYVFRPRLVPLPEPTPEELLQHLAERVADAAERACGGDLRGNNTHEVRMSPEARSLWIELYPRISVDRDGHGGSMMARTEVYARMLAMIFALLQGRHMIEPCDLEAALAWLDYWAESVSYVFRYEDDQAEVDPFSAEVLQLIRSRPGITLSEIGVHWHRKRTGAIRTALEKLMALAPPLVEERKDATTGGRVARRYFPAGSAVSEISEK